MNVMTKSPRTNKRLGRVVALAALPMFGMFALSATTAVAAPATASSGPVVSQSVSAKAQAQVSAYWTPARRAAAKNAEVVAGNAPSPASQAVQTPDGPPSAVPGSAPGGASASLAASPASPASEQPVLVGQPWSYPFPYDAFAVPVKLYKTYPYSVNGTIFFTNNGAGYKCSGTSVANGHQASEVWTAGHCVANTESGKKFDENAEFIPAYNGNGTTIGQIEPYGTFVANNYTTATAWLNNHDETVDFGVMLLNNNKKKETLSAAVGTDGYAWNFGENEQFVQFGYPGESPYNGTKMEENIAATGVSQKSTGSGGNPTGTGSPFTGGSSGGAWNIDWTPEGPGYINGHTDFYYTAKPLTKYSPYFNTLANEVRCVGNPSEC
jgi:V8-like Glu-specific endopeptidase